MENLRWIDEQKTLIGCEIDGRIIVIPATAGNADYDEIIAQKIQIADPDGDE